MRKCFLTLVGLATAFVGAWFTYAADQGQPSDRSAATTARGNANKVTATGTVEPEELFNVYADVPGRIVSLGTDPSNKAASICYGSSVEAGTVLARLDSKPYEFRVEQEQAGLALSEAELDQARAKLELAEAQFQQADNARKGGTIPEAELRIATANYKVAKASLAAAEAALVQKKSALNEAQRNLSSTTIKSPTKGVVIDRRVDVGQIATVGSNTASLFLIADLKKLEIWASVNEADIGRIHPQQSVRITVNALPEKVFEGKVKQIRLNAAMTRGVVTYTVVVAISSGIEGLLPYMTANLEFERQHELALSAFGDFNPRARGPDRR